MKRTAKPYAKKIMRAPQYIGILLCVLGLTALRFSEMGRESGHSFQQFTTISDLHVPAIAEPPSSLALHSALEATQIRLSVAADDPQQENILPNRQRDEFINSANQVPVPQTVFVQTPKVSRSIREHPAKVDEVQQASFNSEILEVPLLDAPMLHGQTKVDVATDATAATQDLPDVARIPVDQAAVLLHRIGNEQLLPPAMQIYWSLDDAIMAALSYSNRVSALQIEAVEELQNVGIESGQFDVTAFIEQRFRDSAEPVGNSIDTAVAQDVINEEDFNISYGFRRQLPSGGDFEISQSFQVRDNDSGILVPRDQAIGRLTAQLNKELLRGSGRTIAMNQVLVAWHDASARRAESVAEIVDHLRAVTEAYWNIFAARGALLASYENRDDGLRVLSELISRANIDAEQNLLDQARAVIGQRELLINEAQNNLLLAQIELISLINAPELLYNSQRLEFMPQVQPDLVSRQVDTTSRIHTAIQRRPEINDLSAQIRSAKVINHLSLNELLPRLSLSLESSLNGLDEARDTGGAFTNQINNDPTYGVGFNFEAPIGNRRARYSKRRSDLAVVRLQTQWQQLIEQIKAEVLSNAQEFSASQSRLELQRNVLQYSSEELRFLELRKTIAPKEGTNPSFALTQLLSAQDRQGLARSQFARAVADKQQTVFELNRATGILVNSDVLPRDGGPAKRGCFAVYHQWIEEKPLFETGPYSPGFRDHTVVNQESSFCNCKTTDTPANQYSNNRVDEQRAHPHTIPERYPLYQSDDPTHHQ